MSHSIAWHRVSMSNHHQITSVMSYHITSHRVHHIPSYQVVTDYVHRAGRTARAGRGGRVLSLVTQVQID